MNMHPILCPYCAQPFDVEIDPTGGLDQEWVIDCEICCRPIVVQVQVEGEEIVSLNALPELD